MLQRSQDSIEWLEFELLADQKELVHRVYLKQGGYSLGSYESLNLSFQVGDQTARVAANLEKISRQLGIEAVVSGRLSHSSRVVSIEAPHQTLSGHFDAMTTQIAEIGLLVTHADCQATLLYDPIRHALAVVHCGWRGNISNIYANTVLQMVEKYGSKPENLLAGISPSLSSQHAEFMHYQTEFPPSLWEFQTSPNHFDLWALATAQLETCGLLPHHIECARRCTYAEPEHFFSYRRTNVCGRHGTVGLLRKRG